jgi:exodeoxyribonuclease VII large subunit
LRFEELKRKLAQEGLFDADQKKRLPSFPQTVAIVTASSGAALRDMLHVLARRAPWVRVLVYSVPVQGAGAHLQIAKAIRWLNEPQAGLPKLDVLVVARGGGSLEDLWSFNEEAVARALADSKLPTISAVGHEIDFTIADFVADLRAPTPSAAAELLAPDRAELSMTLSRWGQSLQYRVRQIIQHHGRVLALMESGNLRRVVERTLANKQQALDEMDATLQQSVVQRFQRQQTRLQELRFRLEQHSPIAELQRRRATLALLREKLQSRTIHRVTKLKSSIDHLRQLLQSLSPDATMARGYTLTMDPQGRPLRTAKQLKPGDEIRTRLSDGEVRSVVKN